MKKELFSIKVIFFVIFCSLSLATMASAASVTNINDLGQYIYTNMETYTAPITVNYSNSRDISRQIERNILNGAYIKDDYTAISYSSIKLDESTDPSNPGAINLTITPTYVETAEQENYVNQQVPKIVSSVIQPGMTDYQKVAALHDWVVSHVKYDNTLQSISDYTALANGITVCRGYSMLLYKLLSNAGFNARIVTGEVQTGYRFRSSGTGHAWNMVQLNGNWYFIDSTNDGLSNDPSTKFFLVSGKTIQKYGFVWNRVNYPSSLNNYDASGSPSSNTTPAAVTLQKLGVSGRIAYSQTPTALKVMGLYSDGKVSTLNNSQVNWTSSDTNVATVDSNGNVTYTGNAGQVTITAASGNISASVTGYVSYVLGLSRISYSTSSQVIKLYKVYNDGVTIPITSGVTWSSLNQSIATVDNNGNVTFTGTQGLALITGTFNGTTAAEQIVVWNNSKENTNRSARIWNSFRFGR